MKPIWLVYERSNVERNRFFIDRWFDAARGRGVGISLVMDDEIRCGIRENKPFIAHRDSLPLPMAAVMRLNRPLLTAHFEHTGIPCFNNAHVARICNDKRLTHQAVSGLAPMMETVFMNEMEKDPPFPYPFVLKSAQGCGGRQVYLVSGHETFRAALEAIRPDGALAQIKCDTPGRDVRVYVLGNRIRKVMLRFSSVDFRSNIGQGGSFSPYELTADERKMVQDIMALFDFGLAGIDFIFHRGRLVFNEIEDAVGTRMLYANGIDIVSEYLDLILDRLG